MELPDYLIRFYAKDEQLLMENTEDSQREFILELYSKSKVTVEDLQRNHTPEEVRELCVRTKLRVNMTYLNSVWDAKKLLNKTNCLDNLSESSINRELVKCVHSKMVQTYTDEDVANANRVAKSELKRANNIRLDRWKRQRECLSPRATSSSLSTLSDTPSEDSFFQRPATPEFSSWDESDTDENQQDHPMDSVLYIKKEPKW
ncbi:telomere-binding protein cav-like isoform X1 [Drosophila obscura]|uniref:telomere-binding protein cav-like isoform X1 n=1 Tax=Drosophila obscura TaxID=7282 RepID=UPI001BB23CF4|nr:telomere-binding protein cav-like isoform X1 [Drosophila obscura]XP_041450677.1 telomere-binding protein cav-like isoform X1 [Drosophila obscura]